MWKLINYFDVWGNQKDGFEVNNLCQEGEPFELSEDVTQEQIVKKLKELNFLLPLVRMNMITFSIWDGDMIELEQRSTGKPICRLERIYNPAIEEPTEELPEGEKGEETMDIHKAQAPTIEELDARLTLQYKERDELRGAYYTAKDALRAKYSTMEVRPYRDGMGALREQYYDSKNLLFGRIRTTKGLIDEARTTALTINAMIQGSTL